MNKKGFTLIELLAVIVLIALIAVLVMPSVLDSFEASKETSYNVLLENIKTAAETYYQECEYGNLSDSTKYGSYACTIKNNTIYTTIGALANTGILKVSDTKNDVLVVLDPRDTSKDLNDCQITITKNKETVKDTNGIENIKVTYTITPTLTSESSLSYCPQDYYNLK